MINDEMKETMRSYLPVILIVITSLFTAVFWPWSMDVETTLTEHESRISVNESVNNDTRRHLIRIENKLDRIIEREYDQ